MATYVKEDSSNGLLGLIIGLLIAAAVAAGLYFFFVEDSGNSAPQTPVIEKNINIETPQAPKVPTPAQAE